ncbi:MAG: hypothetical protein VKJ02_08860 [Snowella sp.]|nr:hypothetical protein [Snowella sp.]
MGNQRILTLTVLKSNAFQSWDASITDSLLSSSILAIADLSDARYQINVTDGLNLGYWA